jgi:uncharacterized membrane protein YgdD (TMEM256/DUF423 family)
MNNIFITIASFFGASAVGIGAFGAHSLNKIFTQNGRLETFETAVKYHFYHTFAILAIGILIKISGENKILTNAAWLFAGGICVFSGTLYILALTNIKWLGAITPIGGLMLIAGWLLLLYYSIKI